MDKTPTARCSSRCSRSRVCVGVCVGAGDALQEDPLLEKGKGKFSKEEQKRKKQNNSWAGKSRD